MIDTIYWEGEVVKMLDQTKLPTEVCYVDCKDYKTVARGIKDLWVRGAPAIGISAAMGIALGASAVQTDDVNAFIAEIDKISDEIGSTRPTAVNLFWAIKRMKKLLDENRQKSVPELKKMLRSESETILREDIEINKKMGSYGAMFINSGDTVLTHCNAGSLATGGYGTALGVIRAAKERGLDVKVIADETRPVLQGARLTAWELMEDNIPVTLITDNMAGYFMKKGMINLCIVGADRIAFNGDTANKIGTYSVAVLARAHNIPFYVAAPVSTIDFSLGHGDLIPIEERDPSEVSNVCGGIQIAPKGVNIYNPAFDVTPAEYIAAIITEKGAYRPRDLHKLATSSAEELESLRIK